MGERWGETKRDKLGFLDVSMKRPGPAVCLYMALFLG
jgi:hypothetical protein